VPVARDHTEASYQKENEAKHPGWTNERVSLVDGHTAHDKKLEQSPHHHHLHHVNIKRILACCSLVVDSSYLCCDGRGQGVQLAGCLCVTELKSM
jgi:hypothetical protein